MLEARFLNTLLWFSHYERLAEFMSQYAVAYHILWPRLRPVRMNDKRQ